MEEVYQTYELIAVNGDNDSDFLEELEDVISWTLRPISDVLCVWEPSVDVEAAYDAIQNLNRKGTGNKYYYRIQKGLMQPINIFWNMRWF